MEGKYFGQMKGPQEQMPGTRPGISILCCAVRLEILALNAQCDAHTAADA
jgi:hypothetical protein